MLIMYSRSKTKPNAALNISNIEKVRLEHFCHLTGLLRCESPPVEFKETSVNLSTTSYLLSATIPHTAFPSSSFLAGLEFLFNGKSPD